MTPPSFADCNCRDCFRRLHVPVGVESACPDCGATVLVYAANESGTVEVMAGILIPGLKPGELLISYGVSRSVHWPL